jgi:signal transduction histidine kinase/ActR/RegA family two-component response regulator
MIRHSISRKLMLVVLATTFTGLLLSTLGILAYDIRSYQGAWVDDLRTQAELIARNSAPAVSFNDPKAARENLAMLRLRPTILAGAIYGPDGALFASYSRDGERFEVPPQALSQGVRIEGEHIVLSYALSADHELALTVYLRARYELWERLRNYALILGAVMLGSLLLAGLISLWLQADFIRPILAVTSVAREVMQRRDFKLRVKKTTSDEIGVLVDAFNDMLNEVGQRAAALEASNRKLEREMAERRSAEQALRLADKRKDEFLATLAHELRNPLAPLMNGLEIMRLDKSGNAATHKAREVMERQLRQMVRLVDDLLDVSRITTGKLVVRKSRVALQAVLQNAVELSASFIEMRGHTLEVALPEAPVWLDADATRLSQVFSNLLNNAAKYTNAGGRIRVAASVAGGNARVEVTDNGIGIAPTMLPLVFDMFIQADYSLERSNAGLGVGLSLARRLVELHDGRLEAHSDGADCGSTFTVTLPLAHGGAAPVSASKPGEATSLGLAPRRILLADDNVDFVHSLESLLSGLGQEVCVTHDGEQAYAAAKDFLPEFAFLDIGLPKLNGYGLARRLRAHAATRDCVLIAVTGWGQERDRELARDAGFDHHMVKPVEPAQLHALLAREWRRATSL